MKVLVLSNNELKEKEIDNTTEELHEIVGGYIEIPFLSRVFNDNKIDTIINEEGKLIDGLRPEIAIIKKGTNSILDIVYGNCIFASHDHEGNTIELNEEQKQIVKEELKTEVILTSPDTGKQYITKALFI